MKKLNQYAFLFIGLLLIHSCKKETKITGDVSNIGTVFGSGIEHIELKIIN